MELDPENAISAVQTGFEQASALIVTYSFSVLGAILLLLVEQLARLPLPKPCGTV